MLPTSGGHDQGVKPSNQFKYLDMTKHPMKRARAYKTEPTVYIQYTQQHVTQNTLNIQIRCIKLKGCAQPTIHNNDTANSGRHQCLT